MRLWSLHPSYLDAQGLVALWREGLLARKVLLGETRGYRHHPQLARFNELKDPVAGIDRYLAAVLAEADARGYSFDASKIIRRRSSALMTVTDGQLAHEMGHLREKLTRRSPDVLARMKEMKEGKSRPHPLFSVRKGAVAPWEKGTDSPAIFPYETDFAKTDFRKHPGRYRVGKGEQGVLLVEPYKSEILPHWRFKTPDVARVSARKIHALFLAYRKAGDFVGMDMARKFLQMGYTRARRYANHPSGRKYASNPQRAGSLRAEKVARKRVLSQAADHGTSAKAEAARIFYGYYLKVRGDATYAKLKSSWDKDHANHEAR